jgi:2-hydroxychromene-2-carboxylate isomerase
MNTGKTLEYFYDFSSPYAYMAVEEVQLVAARCNAELVWKPFLFGGLFKDLGLTGPPVLEASENKRMYYLRDMQRWSELRRLPFRWPSIFPLNAILPLRVMLQLEGPDHAKACRQIYVAYWGDGRDISDPGVLGQVLEDAGLDAQSLLQGTQNPAVKQRLFSHTDEALKRGACGAPTFFVGDLMFWGQDRLDMVERALNGWRPQSG